MFSNPFVAQTRGVSVGMCQRNDGKRRAVCVRSLEERVVRACAHTPRSVYVGGRPPPSPLQGHLRVQYMNMLAKTERTFTLEQAAQELCFEFVPPRLQPRPPIAG